jgi:RNA polymerase sigma factor (sigma-70 family)
MNHASDAALLYRFLDQRDEQAFTDLVARHGLLVTATCRRLLGNQADADDAAQAVFLALATRASELKHHRCLAGCLHLTARHIAGHLRRSNTRRFHREHLAGGLQPQPSPSEDAELREVIDAAIAELPERYRLPLVLHHLGGCDYQAIAEDGKALRIDSQAYDGSRRVTPIFRAMDGTVLDTMPGICLFDAHERQVGSIDADGGTFTYADGPRAGACQPIHGAPSGAYCRLTQPLCSPDGRLLLVKAEAFTRQAQSAFALDLTSGVQLGTTDGPRHASTWLAWSADGAVLSWDGWTIERQDAATGAVTASAHPSIYHINQTVAYDPSEGLLATSAGPQQPPQLWDARTLQPVGSLAAHAGGFQSLINYLVADGPMLLTVSQGGSLRVHDLRTRQSLMEFPGAGQRAYCSCWDPSTGQLALFDQSPSSMSGQTGGLYDPISGRLQSAFHCADGGVVTSAMSVDRDPASGDWLLLGALSDRAPNALTSGIWKGTTLTQQLQLPPLEPVGSLHWTARHGLAVLITRQQSPNPGSQDEVLELSAISLPKGGLRAHYGPWTASQSALSQDRCQCVSVEGSDLVLRDLASGAVIAKRRLPVPSSGISSVAIDRRASAIVLAASDMRLFFVSVFPPVAPAGAISAAKLAALLSDPSPEVACAALDALVALGGSAVPVLEEQASHAPSSAQARALHGLSWLAVQGDAQARLALDRCAAGAGESASAAQVVEHRLWPAVADDTAVPPPPADRGGSGF